MPHNRMGWVTSVAASTGTGSSFTSVYAAFPSPLVAFTAHDAEDAADLTNLGFEVTVFGGKVPITHYGAGSAVDVTVIGGKNPKAYIRSYGAAPGGAAES